jgi:prepilin-type N-terminal cleavage/methylation domain-containing protein
MAANFARRRLRRSFTLVEMLVVVVIIGILAGLITAAAVVAQRTARNTVIVAEIGEMDTAIKAFKEKLGDYPPDGTDPQAVTRFLARAFPQYRGALPATVTLNPASSLVFWLGGPLDASGLPTGFSANPRNPFDTSQSKIGPFFEFDRTRLKSDAAGGGLRYLPPNSNPQSEPYVYFRAKVDGTGNPAYSGNFGNAKPCRDTRVAPAAWANPKHFQIRSPGLDGKHGTGVSFPDGSDYSPENNDDQANFCSRGKFADEMP